MDQKLVNTISKQVYRRFPDVNEKKPKVRKQTAIGKSPNSKTTYLLTYHGKVKAQGGKIINCYVRVVADANGKIIKMSSSR